MFIKFYKYHGTGNDFILFDNRNLILRSNMHTLYAHICDRRFGIGGDGVMLFQNHPDLDFEMIYFNADGAEGSMCGNGARCMIKFAKHLGIDKQNYKFSAADGVHEARVDGEIIKLKMHDVQAINHNLNYYELNTGSPHYIEFFDAIDSIDIKKEGARVRYSEKYFKEGINVNFIQAENNGIKIRTYERGVEDETYSCGTGVTASAIAYSAENKFIDGNYIIDVKTLGGNLKVSFEKVSATHYRNIWLIGPAEFVFSGEIEIK